MYKSYELELNKLKSGASERRVQDIRKDGKHIILNNKKLLNLSSNDYLGLSENFDIVNEFLRNSNYSFGSASARLLTGTSPVYFELEKLISKLYKKESALLFNSGYHANVGIFSSIAGKKDVIFSDKLNHASIVDGMKLSGASFYRYKHLNYEHLKSLLEKHRNSYDNAIIISESVFSMDGDIADLSKLIELKKKYNAILAVDEAHAFGVFGENALGISELSDCTHDVDLIIATFGKAIASYGAFCVGNKVLIGYLINKARSFIFSTSLPEINIAYSKFIIENILPDTKNARKELLTTASNFRKNLIDLRIKTAGESHIIPIVIGKNEDTVTMSNKLQDEGYFVLPIRYPTVPVNSSRIRVSLRADITYNEISKIPDMIVL